MREGELAEDEVCLAFLRFFSERRRVARILLASELGVALRRELEERTTALFAEGAAAAYDLSAEGSADALRFVSAGFYRFYDDVIMSDEPAGKDELRQRAALGARLSSAGLERCLGRAAS